MKEIFKLRKSKVGLVSVAITALCIFAQNEAEASESENSQAVENQKINTIEEDVTVSQPADPSKEIKTTDTTKNFVNVDPIKPGDQKVTGTTLPNQLISLNIDKKDVSSADSGDSGFVMSDDKGKFKYDLKDRKIVHNQEIEVFSSSMEDEEMEEANGQNESTDAVATYTTPRYEKAYKIPKEQLNKENGHHQVFIEPITEGSGIIKGHTSVKGKVALAVNNKFIDFGSNNDTLKEEEAPSRYNGIWKYIDKQGYFDFDFKRMPFSDLSLKENDTVSLSFLPDDEEDAIKPINFTAKVNKLDDIDTATTVYDHTKVAKVKVLSGFDKDLQVDDIYGFSYPSERAKETVTSNENSTQEIKGKTKFANAVVKVYSDLREGHEFPDLQVDERGEFSFNSFEAKYQLFNGEKLTFVVVDPITGDPLTQMVTKKINAYETPEQKHDRELDEKSESIPAYHKLYGDQIIGFNVHDMPITWFYPLDKK
ncbi:TPA: FKLRK protein [Staphylococcus aureus]